MSNISISEFREKFALEPASTNRFIVDIRNGATGMSTGSPLAGRYPDLMTAGLMRYRCRHVDLPGKGINTAGFTAYGPTRKFASGVIYAPIQISVICSDDWREKKFFDDWHNIVINSSDLTSAQEGTHDTNYYDDYADFVMDVFTYDREGNMTSSYEIQECYPTSVAPVNMDWAMTNDMAILQVEMNYRMWRRTK